MKLRLRVFAEGGKVSKALLRYMKITASRSRGSVFLGCGAVAE